jgi:hypothetical protein
LPRLEETEAHLSKDESARPEPDRVTIDKPFTLYYKVNMNTFKRSIAFVELVLVLPATLFMTALFVRNLQPQPLEPARSAGRLVDWFSARPHLGLHLSLIALPLVALVIGCASVLRTWKRDPEFREAVRRTVAMLRSHLASLVIAAATLIAGGILSIVALHVISD